MQENVWTLRPGWMDTKNFAPTEVRTLHHSAHGKSLYWLHYTGHHSVSYWNTLKVLTQLQFSVWNISFYEVPFLLISGNSREGYAFSISEARSTLKRLVIHKWIIPDGIFHIFLPNQHQTLCAVLILGDIFLRKDDSLKETSHSININTHAM